MKKLILIFCIMCICIPVYSAIKDHTIFEKSIDVLKSIRASAVSAENILKGSQNTASSLLTSYTTIIIDTDKTSMQTINTKLNATLTALNDLISTIDNLYPEIK